MKRKSVINKKQTKSMSKERMKKAFMTALTATLLTGSMIIPQHPVQAHAETVTNTTQLKNLSQGDVIEFAGYEWYVLDPSSGYLIMKDTLGSKQFDPTDDSYERGFDVNDSDNIGYYLNHTWLDSLSKEDQEAIQTKTWQSHSYDPDGQTVSKIGNRTFTAKVGLISVDEWKKYSYAIDSSNVWYYKDSSRGKVPNQNEEFWTRDEDMNGFWVVQTSGIVLSGNTYQSYHVKPTIYLNPEMNIKVVNILGNKRPNQVPVAISISNQEVLVNSIRKIDLSKTFHDVDGDDLTLNSSSSDDSIASTVLNDKILTIKGNKVGSAKITVTANDGHGESVSTSFTIRVSDSASTETKTIKEMSKGSVIRFAGYDWYVLEPSTGYILMKDSITQMVFDSDQYDSKFNPNDSNNIGYYLNTTWYNTLTSEEKNLIQYHSWDITTHGIYGSTGNPSTVAYVNAKVGLISSEEWKKYSRYTKNNPDYYVNYDPYAGFLPNPFSAFWTRSYSSFYTDSPFIVTHDGGVYPEPCSFYTKGVRPALYLNTSVMLSSKGEVVTTDTTPPEKATFTPSTTDPVADHLTLTINYPGDAYTKQYKIGEDGEWLNYV